MDQTASFALVSAQTALAVSSIAPRTAASALATISIGSITVPAPCSCSVTLFSSRYAPNDASRSVALDSISSISWWTSAGTGNTP